MILARCLLVFSFLILSNTSYSYAVFSSQTTGSLGLNIGTVEFNLLAVTLLGSVFLHSNNNSIVSIPEATQSESGHITPNDWRVPTRQCPGENNHHSYTDAPPAYYRSYPPNSGNAQGSDCRLTTGSGRRSDDPNGHRLIRVCDVCQTAEALAGQCICRSCQVSQENAAQIPCSSSQYPSGAFASIPLGPPPPYSLHDPCFQLPSNTTNTAHGPHYHMGLDNFWVPIELTRSTTHVSGLLVFLFNQDDGYRNQYYKSLFECAINSRKVRIFLDYYEITIQPEETEAIINELCPFLLANQMIEIQYLRDHLLSYIFNRIREQHSYCCSFCFW